MLIQHQMYMVHRIGHPGGRKQNKMLSPELLLTCELELIPGQQPYRPMMKLFTVQWTWVNVCIGFTGYRVRQRQA